MKTVTHEFAPFIPSGARVLILGSIPSPKSREEGFYYMHPQNRFWKVLATLYGEEVPLTVFEKKQFLTKYKIALWDVIASCDIEGARDETIHNIKVNDIKKVLEENAITTVYTTGKKAYFLYQKYCYKDTNIEAIYLPSTSPANAAFSLATLIEQYTRIKEGI